MATGNISSSTTVGLNKIPDFIMESMSLDVDNDAGETYYYFTEASTNLGYYKDPLVASAINGLATWAFSKGWSADPVTTAELKHITGRGNDTFATVMWNHEVMKLVMGDAFMEIVWNKKGDIILNLIPISAERVKIVSKGGRIIRYEVWDGKNKWKKVKTEDMYHSSNKRIGDQIHGTSQISFIKKYIDYRNEAVEDERVIKHRDKAIGIAKYKTSNTGKIEYVNQQIKNGVDNGDMIGVPQDSVDFEAFPVKSSEDRQPWIQYLENFTYGTAGVPRSMITSDGTSEVGGKMGHVIFEPIYGKEQQDEEENFEIQTGRIVHFFRPPSLGGLMQETEQKNTGQLNIQPNDVQANLERE